MDNNIYSTSSFIQLTRSNYGLDILELSRVLNEPITTIKEYINGSKQLGRDNYFKIIEHIGEDIQCDYMGEYNANR